MVCGSTRRSRYTGIRMMPGSYEYIPAGVNPKATLALVERLTTYLGVDAEASDLRAASLQNHLPAFEICDFLGDAPDFHLLPVGNAGNIAAYWLGYTQYEAAGKATTIEGPEFTATAANAAWPASVSLSRLCRA